MDEPVWREMRESDLDAAAALAAVAHPGRVQRAEIFADRLALFPQGCRVLAGGDGVEGYAVSHPARLLEPPPADAALGTLPADADCYHIQDVVVAPRLRDAGHARIGVYHALDIGAAYRETALVSGEDALPFWLRFGFADRTADVDAARLAPFGPRARYLVRRKSAVEFTPRAG